VKKLKRKQSMFGYNADSILDVFLLSCTQKGIYLVVLPQAMSMEKDLLHDFFGNYKTKETCEHCGQTKTPETIDRELFDLLGDTEILLILFDSLEEASAVYRQLDEKIGFSGIRPGPQRAIIEIWQHGKKVEHNRLPWLLHVDNQ
jgi:hypothetical protein